MNIKTIVIGSLAVTLAVGSTYVKFSSDKKEAAYTPRNGVMKSNQGSPDKINDYLNLLRGNPSTGVVDLNDYNKVKNEVVALSKQSNNKTLGMVWDQRGPDNVGGRTRAILVDKNNANIVYAGSVAGGLFVSQDAGITWAPINSLGDNLAISCLTQTDNGRIFFGTGNRFESTINGSSLGTPGFPGNGLYEYVPGAGGAVGTVLPVLINSATVPVNSTAGDLARINQIDAQGNRLYIGTRVGLRFADPDGSGNYPTTINGWTNPIIIPGPNIPLTTEVHDIDVATDGSMMISFAGETWTSQDGSLGSFTEHTFPGTSRISSAIAPSNPDFLYVVGTNGAQNLTNFWASLDRGATWSIIIPGGVLSIDPFSRLDGSGQGTYDQAIAVDPSNPGRVIVGGIEVYEFDLNPGQVPIGGNWVQITSTLIPEGNPLYIHADNHTIEWVDANTVYIGGDGGVFKSVDGGVTWAESNLGYNVTTFFSVATAANGYFLGGSQDNSCQLFDFGELGATTSPNGTVEVSSGDGFTVAFSNFSGGIAYTTSQFGNVNRLSPGGAGGSFFDNQVQAAANGSPFNTEIRNWESLNDPLSIDSVEITLATDTVIGPGQPFTYTGLTTNTLDLVYEPSVAESYNAGDVIKLVDPIQNRFAFSSGSDIYITKDAARLGATPEWHKIANTAGIISMEFSPDGNHIYLGNTAGQLFRVSGLALGNDDSTLDIDVAAAADLVITRTTIASGLGGVVTGIAVDPNNGENVIATVGGYGVNNHVWRSTNAQSATSSANAAFVSIQGTPIPTANGYLPRMPVYDAEIDVRDNDIVLIGTDFGIWASENAFSAAANLVTWENESEFGMAHTPVFEVVQQTLPLGTFAGHAIHSQRYYLGTHGRGFYTSDSRVDSTLVGIDEPGFNGFENGNRNIANLAVYPNPINAYGTIEFDLYEQGEMKVNIYNLTGSLVKTIDLGTKAKGNHKERLDVSSLSIGSYIVSLESNTDRTVSKMIITR